MSRSINVNCHSIFELNFIIVNELSRKNKKIIILDFYFKFLYSGDLLESVAILIGLYKAKS